ncbi:transglutaminase family protein [Actinophytocola sp. NPDC049390]|uniref:transglutaminase family protein n=1 Tax=Actinophytocola sp. NPDC049390 TaxID=3363894 RepID=UPI003795B258
MSEDLRHLCAPTEFMDYENPVVRDFVAKTLDDTDRDPVAKAVKLYYAVRDGLRYEVYGNDLSNAGMKASAIIERGFGFCIQKSLTYAACLRSVGVPSRVVYGDVRNHLASPRLRELVGGDLFRFHSLTQVYLNGRWLKATPVFNKTLCMLYRITPQDFDGTADAVYHPFDEQGRQHMEFLRWHGEFDDFPYDLVIGAFRTHHPKLVAANLVTASGSLEDEAADQRALLATGGVK